RAARAASRSRRRSLGLRPARHPSTQRLRPRQAGQNIGTGIFSRHALISARSFSHDERPTRAEGTHVTETIRRHSDHPMKRSFETTPSDTAARSEDGWVDMDVRWLLTSETVGA